MNLEQLSSDYRRIETAINYLETHHREQPDLQSVAAATNLSEYHFQRLFSRWVGISPKRFLQFLTKEHAKQLLAQSHSVLDASFESGMSGPGRLHDLFVQCEAVTPGEYKQHGAGIDIQYGFHPSPFGECLLAVSDRGITNLMFVRETSKNLLDELQHRWKHANLVQNQSRTGEMLQHIFRDDQTPQAPLHLYLKGTNFQMKVWEALLRIPSGQVISYEAIATAINQPTAVRAVASAVGKNPVAYLIPCHRVIRKSGAFNEYRWGSARKKAMLLWEESRVTATP